MADFINTIDALGDNAVFDSIINGTITEFKDDTVSRVGQYAFYKCTALETVDVPNADDVDMCAFQNCSSLKTANIPEATRVNQWAFGDCKALADITAPKVTRIDANAFKSCYALKRVVFPVLDYLDASVFASCRGLEFADVGTVKTIGGTVFNSCQALKALVIRKTDAVTTINGNSFNSTPIADGTGYIYVPSALIDSYRAAANWSTFANQFRKLEEWTVDGTITGELDIENRHMVRFFNSDGTLLSYVIVPTGGTAVYVGDTPVNPDGPSHPFVGFVPSPTNVTADMDCYAEYADPYTWSSVQEAISNGTYKDIYKIGDLVPIDLGTYGVHEMEIVAFDADDKSDGSGKAAISWISKGAITKHMMNNTSTNANGWEASAMRSWLHEEVYNSISIDVLPLIVDVSKTYYDKTSATTKTCVDSIWIPSMGEIFGNSYDGSGCETLGVDYTSHFKTGNNRVKKNTDGTTSRWWLRSAYSGSATAYRYVTYNGTPGNNSATGTDYGVVLGFCT